MIAGGKGAMRNSNPNGNASSRTAAWPRKRNAAAKMKETNARVERQRRISGDGIMNQITSSSTPIASETNAPDDAGAGLTMTDLRRRETRYALMKGIRMICENVSEW